MATAGAVSSGPSSSTGSTGTQKMASSEGLGSPSSSQTTKKTIDPTGETTYKKTTSSVLRDAIQLGITHTVGSLTQKPERDVLMQDFEVVESIFFPSAGSNLTPAHRCGDFRFKTYAPIAFRYFREMYGIRPDDYLYSLCNEPLIELSNPGASGSIFYVSSDDEFIIKTVQHKEAEFLQKLLPGYFMNLNQNKRTLLPKFYGLYCVQAAGKNIRIVVMNNLLPQSVRMHHKYDLKGSTYKRRASAKEREKYVPTYKDLDFIENLPNGLTMELDNYNALCKTIQRDCLLLQSFKIMDYSLLVGIHNLEQACRERVGEEAAGGAADQKRPQGQKSLYCTPIEAIQGEAKGKGALELEDHMGGIPAKTTKGERFLVFIGIIDILQSYRFVKKLEHYCKALVHDGDSVSVHRPGFYADRFQKFMCNTVFNKKVSLKTSPSKKSRGGAQGVVRRANTAASGTSYLGQASSSTARVPHSLSTETETETEGDSGMQSGCPPDLLQKTPTHDDVTSDSAETTVSASSLGSTGFAPTSHAVRSVGVEVHDSDSTDQESSASKSVEVGTPEECSGGNDIISLTDDLVPQTNSCIDEDDYDVMQDSEFLQSVLENLPGVDPNNAMGSLASQNGNNELKLSHW